MIRSIIHAILDSSIVKLVNYIDSKRVKPKWVKPERLTVIDILERQAATESAQYAEAHMSEALYFRTREELWRHALANITLNGIYMEFGVYRGSSINWFAGFLPDKTIIGFDSFEGLPDDWAMSKAKKHFDLGGKLPAVRANVVLVKGTFEHSLPEYLVSNNGIIALAHMDADTYGSTKSVLALLRPRLRSGSVFVFDQYFGYHGWKLGEWKAWQEFSKREQISYHYLSFSYQQVGIVVERVGG